MSNAENLSRRNVLKGGFTGMTAIIASGTPAAGEKTNQSKSEEKPQHPKVRYEELLPHKFRKRLADKPLAYLPLGTIEWHGEHIALGADAIQSQSLMVQCAIEYGGIVMPPLYLGPDRAKLMEDGRMLFGMDYDQSTDPNRQLDGSCYWIPEGFHMELVDVILGQLKRAGFRAVFADGHGPSRRSWVENLEERETRFGLKLFGVTEDIAEQWRSQIDHAAINETSLMMYYRPDLVDLSQLPESRTVSPQGVGFGKDPRDATVNYGKECMLQSLEIMKRKFAEAGI
jgi:creatinine amidohydrolase